MSAREIKSSLKVSSTKSTLAVAGSAFRTMTCRWVSGWVGGWVGGLTTHFFPFTHPPTHPPTYLLKSLETKCFCYGLEDRDLHACHLYMGRGWVGGWVGGWLWLGG